MRHTALQIPIWSSTGQIHRPEFATDPSECRRRISVTSHCLVQANFEFDRTLPMMTGIPSSASSFGHSGPEPRVIFHTKNLSSSLRSRLFRNCRASSEDDANSRLMPSNVRSIRRERVLQANRRSREQFSRNHSTVVGRASRRDQGCGANAHRERPAASTLIHRPNVSHVKLRGHGRVPTGAVARRLPPRRLASAQMQLQPT
jgi:hypothetical protein